jgi:hypothetical protein
MPLAQPGVLTCSTSHGYEQTDNSQYPLLLLRHRQASRLTISVLKLPKKDSPRYCRFSFAAAGVGLLQIAGCGREMIAESSYCQRFGICNEHIKADRVPVQGIECRWVRLIEGGS